MIKRQHFISLLAITTIFLISLPAQAFDQSPLKGLDEYTFPNQNTRWSPQMSPLVDVCSNYTYDTAVAYNKLHDSYLVVCSKADRITGRRVSSRGEIESDEFDIFTFTYGQVKEPRVAYDDINDQFLVIWFYRANVVDTDFHVYGRFMDWDGPSSGNLLFQISESNSKAFGEDHFGNLAFAHMQGTYLVVWANEMAPNHNWILGRQIPTDGSPMAPSFLIVYDSGNSLKNPSVAYNLARNEFLVVYDNAVDIYGIRLNHFGSPLGIGSFHIAGWPSTEYEPAVAACHNADQYLVGWHSIEGSDEGVYARFITGEGTLGTVLNPMHRNYNSGTIDIDMDCGKTDLLMESPNYLVAWAGMGEAGARMIETGGSMSDPVVVYNGTSEKIAVAGGKMNFLVATSWTTLTMFHGVSARIVGNTKPKAAFTVTPTKGDTTTNFQYDASATSDNTDNDADLQVRWDWENDGIYDTNWTKTKTANHIYNLSAGLGNVQIVVRLEVTDGRGATDTTTQVVTVATPNIRPAASFTVQPTAGTLTTNFLFDASSSSDPEDPTSKLEVRWDWENNGVFDTDWSTDKTVTHKFSSIGVYTVRLMVRDTGGLTAQTTREVRVGEQVNKRNIFLPTVFK